MSRTRENPRDRLSSVEGVRALLQREGWPLPVQELDQPGFLLAQAHEFVGARTHDLSGVEDLMPEELFTLAVDTLYGPYPEGRELRFRAARCMVMQHLDKVGELVRKDNGDPYIDGKTGGIMVRRHEGNYNRAVGATARMRLSAQLAEPYGVSAGWLAALPSDDQSVGVELARMAALAGHADTYAPRWLAPWIGAVTVAVSICELVNNDLLLTDAAYAGEMLESLLAFHRPTIAADPAAWNLMLYYPLIHPALVAARELTLRQIPAWMQSRKSPLK